MTDPLGDALVALGLARAQALVRADDDQAARLATLAHFIGEEADYVAGLAAGLSPVRRRTDVPEGVALGWFLRRDPAVRQARRCAGFSVPEDLGEAA